MTNVKPILLIDFGSTYTKVTAVDADAGELLFQAPERELARAAEEELLAELRRMRSSQPTQGEQGTRPRRPTPMRGLLI